MQAKDNIDVVDILILLHQGLNNQSKFYLISKNMQNNFTSNTAAFFKFIVYYNYIIIYVYVCIYIHI